jgi:acetoin utilization deacetylase AcuC-like enzyme
MIPFPPERPQRILNFLAETAKNSAVKAGSVPGAVHQIDNSCWQRLPSPCSDQPEKTRNTPHLPPIYHHLLRVHAQDYLDTLFGLHGEAALEQTILNVYELLDDTGTPHRYDKTRAVNPLTALFRTVTLARLEGTYHAAQYALETDEHFCFYLAGGNHHARYATGAGFCLLNDLVYAARRLQAEGQARLIWFIDVDAHKGCGSTELVTYIRNGTNPYPFEKHCNILTLSAHMARGWPLDEKTLAHAALGKAPCLPSDIEIPIEAGEEDLYCAKLSAGLMQIEAMSAGQQCDLAIVVDGSDPYEYDGLASSALLKLTRKQCLERDMLIYHFLRERNIPSAWTLAGGYGERAWEPAATFLAALNDNRAG